ncbi:GNAT family N-acetyltransferase [Stutzerimonas balearica]|uniref:GNAT family N-acetyltransferase n=1 Tax=Stutzerimonas balearica TaxID=74829 RepID=UPI0009711A2E|nr:GNAT family N-acetyltransferase [Stutzerimonas balearica]OMG65686.1 GNAT family N-acetyltransferase [Stutzerimonas balearica]
MCDLNEIFLDTGDLSPAPSIVSPASMPDGGMRVRRAACRDLLALFAIHRALFLPHIARLWGWDERWQRANFLEVVATASTWVVEGDSGIVGYLQFEEQARRIYLRNIALVPAYQRRGVGTRLVEALKTKASARRIPLTLSVFRTNLAARRFYERQGFTATHEARTHIDMRWVRPGASDQCPGSGTDRVDSMMTVHGSQSVDG